MSEKNYTHKIVMFDVNSKQRVAKFESLENAAKAVYEAGNMAQESSVALFGDDKGTTFNLNNIVQMNDIEVVACSGRDQENTDD